jgi:hypothetical protein
MAQNFILNGMAILARLYQMFKKTRNKHCSFNNYITCCMRHVLVFASKHFLEHQSIINIYINKSM